MAKTKEDKLKILNAEIAAAEEAEDETYLKYVIRIKEMTITIEDGGIMYMNSGSPPPPPPYGGGG